MLFSLLFLACGGSEFASHPDYVGVDDLAKEYDYQEHQLAVYALKEKFSVGAIQSKKVWDERVGEEVEYSYISLKQGEKEVGVLASAKAKDLDRDEFRDKGQKAFDDEFKVDPMNPSSVRAQDGAMSAALVGINMAECMEAQMDAFMESAMAELEEKCDKFQSPNEKWLEYEKKMKIEEADRIIDSKSDYLKDQKKAAEAKKKYYESLTNEKFIESKRAQSEDLSCLKKELLDNSYARFQLYDVVAQSCGEYIDRAKAYKSATSK